MIKNDKVTLIDEFCPECGAKLRTNAKYCGNCGVKIDQDKKMKEKKISSKKIQMEDGIKLELEKEYAEKIKRLNKEFIEKIKKEKEKIEKNSPLFNERQYKILIGVLFITIIVLVGFFIGKMYKII